MNDRRLDETLRHLHPPKGVKPWHGGPTALAALRGVSAKIASWRPYPDRHSIWDLALHIAYWNYAVERRLTDAPSGTFPRQPANWPRRANGSLEAAWAEDRALLKTCHAKLVETLRGFDVSRLDERAGDGRTTYGDLVTGVLLHDTYHAGQVQMLKRLARSRGL